MHVVLFCSEDWEFLEDHRKGGHNSSHLYMLIGIGFMARVTSTNCIFFGSLVVNFALLCIDLQVLIILDFFL